MPLGELVPKVSADTGVRLTSAPSVADEPVAVVVKELPARELLEQLADLLDYRWQRLESGSKARRTEAEAPAAGRAPSPSQDRAPGIQRPITGFEMWQERWH